MAEQRALTVSDVAERLRMRPEGVRRMLRDGRIRGVRLGGTRLGWRIPESEVERLLRGELAGAVSTGRAD
jgi:excisionase family DNA binding protein